MPSYRIDHNQLMKELDFAAPTLRSEADAVMKENFDAAVNQMISDFEEHTVTKEIMGGVDSPNLSNTLGGFRNKKEDSTANLTSFIGFRESPSEVIHPILIRLYPQHDDGPKFKPAGREKNRTIYHYIVTSPNLDKIYSATPFPDNWLEGDISWAKRIEEGIPGVHHFLNKKGVGRSGGGVQIEGVLEEHEEFDPVPYLSDITNNFLTNLENFAFHRVTPKITKRYYNVRDASGRFTKK